MKTVSALSESQSLKDQNRRMFLAQSLESLLTNSLTQPQYFKTAQELYTVINRFKDDQTQKALENIFNQVVINACYIINTTDSDSIPKSNFNNIFKFLCGKYDVNDASFVSRLDDLKHKEFFIKYRPKSKKYQYIGIDILAAEVISQYVLSSNLIGETDNPFFKEVSDKLSSFIGITSFDIKRWINKGPLSFKDYRKAEIIYKFFVNQNIVQDINEYLDQKIHKYGEQIALRDMKFFGCLYLSNIKHNVDKREEFLEFIDSVNKYQGSLHNILLFYSQALVELSTLPDEADKLITNLNRYISNIEHSIFEADRQLIADALYDVARYYNKYGDFEKEFRYFSEASRKDYKGGQYIPFIVFQSFQGNLIEKPEMLKNFINAWPIEQKHLKISIFEWFIQGVKYLPFLVLQSIQENLGYTPQVPTNPCPIEQDALKNEIFQWFIQRYEFIKYPTNQEAFNRYEDKTNKLKEYIKNQYLKDAFNLIYLPDKALFYLQTEQISQATRLMQDICITETSPNTGEIILRCLYHLCTIPNVVPQMDRMLEVSSDKISQTSRYDLLLVLVEIYRKLSVANSDKSTYYRNKTLNELDNLMSGLQNSLRFTFSNLNQTQLKIIIDLCKLTAIENLELNLKYKKYADRALELVQYLEEGDENIEEFQYFLQNKIENKNIKGKKRQEKDKEEDLYIYRNDPSQHLEAKEPKIIKPAEDLDKKSKDVAQPILHADDKLPQIKTPKNYHQILHEYHQKRKQEYYENLQKHTNNLIQGYIFGRKIDEDEGDIKLLNSNQKLYGIIDPEIKISDKVLLRQFEIALSKGLIFDKVKANGVKCWEINGEKFYELKCNSDKRLVPGKIYIDEKTGCKLLFFNIETNHTAIEQGQFSPPTPIYYTESPIPQYSAEPLYLDDKKAVGDCIISSTLDDMEA